MNFVVKSIVRNFLLKLFSEANVLKLIDLFFDALQVVTKKIPGDFDDAALQNLIASISKIDLAKTISEALIAKLVPLLAQTENHLYTINTSEIEEPNVSDIVTL